MRWRCMDGAEKVCARAVSDDFSAGNVCDPRPVLQIVHHVGGLLSPWGERVNCAVIAGLLLYEAGKQNPKLSTSHRDGILRNSRRRNGSLL